MEAIILAGGVGARLKHIISDVPKPMAPICNKPFLAILLESLNAKGIEKVVLSIGYMGEVISEYFGDHYKNIQISYEHEDTPLGTGGAIRQALSHCTSDHVFIFNGDTFIDIELDALEAKWQLNNNPIIVGRKVEDCSRFGLLEHDNNRVTSFTEKSGSGVGIINAGAYVFPSNLINDIKQTRFSIEADFLMTEVKKKQFDIFITKGKFIDIGVPEEFERAQIELLSYTY